jgi:nucleotide-binding universal stress UspA family protein
MTNKMGILLYSDGSAVGSQALALGKRIARALAKTVDILAIARTPERKEWSSEEIEDAVSELETADVSVTVYRRPGTVDRELLEQADAKDYDLIVIGSKGRRGIRRLLAGSKACSILGGAATSVLVVKGRKRERIARILACSAAGPASEETIQFAARLARALGASVTLLHVMSQVALEENAKGADLEAGAAELIEGEAREGAHLEAMLEILESEDVEAEAVVRHGLVVDKIIAEAREGHFDMLVIGAHTTPNIAGLLSIDLAQQIMLTVDRPILIVHQE